MTHTRNTAASDETATRRMRGADARATNRPSRARRDGPTAGDRGGRTFPAEGHEGRAYRARAEPMTVRPLRDGRYVVESEGGTYVVDIERTTCTCPDNAIRGARCKHIRRVSLEIEAGAVPAPNERERVCAVCGGRTFGPIDDWGPALCDRHDHAPGDVVRDRETGSLLVVVEALGERADEARTDEGRLVSEYETNTAYGGQEPVFAAVYAESLPIDPGDARRYLFPASRLRPLPKDAGRDDVSRRGAGADDAGRDRASSLLGPVVDAVADIGQP